MAGEVEKALGAPEVAGTLVNPKGLMKKTVARTAGREVAGLVGSLAAGAATRDGSAPDLPSFGRVGYVAVSDTEVAVLKTRTGWKMHPTEEVLARAPGASSPRSSSTRGGWSRTYGFASTTTSCGSSTSRGRTRRPPSRS